MSCHADETAYGCLFCRRGRESSVAAEVERRFPQVKALVPLKTRYWRHRGEATQEQAVLFPCYVFFRARHDFNAYRIMESKDIYRLLWSSEKDWMLYGDDRRIAEKIFETEGVIGLSKAYFDGGRIRITEGFLKDYEGKIIRVNRRAGTAQIKVQLYGKDTLLWLGFEDIDDIEKKT